MAGDMRGGLGVDDDPTANVIALVQSGLSRQDDLREMTARHLEEKALLRAHYDGLLRIAESARIDAIRTVDVNSVTKAAEASAQQAAVLAGQVAASAEALRAQVELARIQTADALNAALEPIKTDVADLRKVQYEQQGQKQSQVENKTGAQWIATAVIAFLVLLVAAAGLAVSRTKTPAITVNVPASTATTLKP